MRPQLHRNPLALLLAVLIFALPLSADAHAQDLPSPEAFFGHQMGADRQLASWDRLVEYYRMLGERSPRMNVVEMGPSTLGNPFLVLFISSPENLARLDEIQRMNALLSDPRGASQAEIDRAVEQSRVVFVQSYGLHSSEVAGTETAAEVTYDMLTRDDEEMLRILDNTVAIMIPALNPDGKVMIKDWYDRWVGTEYEGAQMPWLYHPYIGHDNNRDAFMQNTIESRYGAEILFREWIPQGFIDHHQMGEWGPRLYVPPYAEPIRPDADPLVWREMDWYGGHIVYEEELAGKIGVINAAIYSGWGHFGFHWITPFHNIAGMLTESASARLATPLYVHPDQLEGRRQLPEYEAQTTFPSPWPGGWWRVRDIVEQQKIASIAPLDIAALNREMVLRAAAEKALRQTARGAAADIKGYIIPAEQHDPLTKEKMVNKLLLQGIEVHRAPQQFTHEGRVYGAGTYVVSKAQPKMGVIRWLLGQTYYPDNTYTRDREGNPIRPYDMSTDNIAEYMGVRVEPYGTPVEDVRLAVVDELIEPEGRVAAGPGGYVLDGSLNDSYHAVNLLLDEGVDIRRVERPVAGLDRGDFLVDDGASANLVRSVAAETGVDFQPVGTEVSSGTHPVQRQRIGMYHRYYGGNMDEGWTRWLLEQYAFPYDSLFDARIQQGNLGRDYDVIILADDDVAMMTGERGPEARDDWEDLPENTPPEYRSGFGQQGVDALRDFVRNGGTLVTFARAGTLPIEAFPLPIRNVVADLPGKEFWSPGSTLRVDVNNDHPLAYGMPDDALAMFLLDNQAYEVIQHDKNHLVDRIVVFEDRDILESGWLLGEDRIAEKAAMVSVRHGEGRVVLIGFRAQHRAQTHGTFKLVFNSLLTAPMGGDGMAVDSDR